MNHIYHSIWNDALGAWIAVSEIATGQGKRSSNRRKKLVTASPLKDWQSSTPLLATGLLLCSSTSWALPTGNQLMAGQATVNTPSAGQMQINQASQQAIINWQGFSIAPTEAVNIQQPNAQAALLNRVVGQDASQIQGQLHANGQVYLVNPNGVLFGKTAQVDVGGLIASTHDISNADFIAGKNHFTQNGATGTIENQGTINVPEGGVVALISTSVTNTGSINTPKGTTALAVGKTVDLDFQGNGLVEVKVSEAALNAQITNKGAIQADGGRVVLTAKAAGQLIDTVINQQGIIKAHGLAQRNGEILLEGDYVAQTGIMDVSGTTGGKVAVNARAILDAGKTNADGTAGNGGNINFVASDAIIQTASVDTHANGTATGGTVHLEAVNSVFSSGKLSATGQQGGTIDVVSSDRVVLAAANVDASGTKQGGLIRVGGDFHGANAKLPNAKTTIINGSSKLKADGGKGQVVVWSEQQTDYNGSISANLAGNIEVSSKGLLNYAGHADAGVGGRLLLDPKNIVISANAGVANYALIDPHLAANNNFGSNTTLLGTTANKVFTSNGNMVVSSPNDSFAAASAGAVYLFNTTTGALLSSLTGTQANDRVGSTGITALSNGNYVVGSSYWANGTATGAGAVTWGNGTTGVSGAVSSSNSLVGTQVGDNVGWNGITALSNGNYVVNSSIWANGTARYVGAVTWGNGATGVSGAVSSSNSLVGSQVNNYLGKYGITALNNGNYVVGSPNWANGTATGAGAVTWGNGTTGVSGVVSSSNSLVGFQRNDAVGSSGITALSNGNYVVRSNNWANGTAMNAGAVTWGNGSTGITGVVSSSNSLVGSQRNDAVGSSGIALSNGNYVVGSSSWNKVGAVTWGNGATGISGVVSSSNSLVGTQLGDGVGKGGITALSNGNYVVSSNIWANGTAMAAGAVTWGNGSTGITGVVSSSNSLVGSQGGDNVGWNGITALSNGNYVVGSSNWTNGTAMRAGAVTWGNGSIGVTGAVSSSNSLVGTNLNDQVGSTGITALSNGNYVVDSSHWTNGTAGVAGAVTWGNGATGVTGAVSSNNSLVGSQGGDSVGWDGITALSNGNYVVNSSGWANGTARFAGAVTWGNGTTGVSGAVSSSNSLVGSQANDAVGSSGITALSNGNYVVRSGSWANGTATYAGAVTWGNGTTGVSGAVSSSNSLVGTQVGDNVGIGSITDLMNGNYAVASPYQSNGGLLNAGQVRIVTPQNIYFNNGVGQTMTFNPSLISQTLAAGTNVTLQASNDITLNAGTDILVGGSNGGAFTMQAGRNINLNSKIVTANGNFTAVAGDPNAIAADRDAGLPTITLGSGASINAGTGKVVLAAINGNFVNNSGSTTPITASQWLVYSTDPSLNTRNGMVADFKHYAQPYTGTTPSYAANGNWFLYSITPTLTVTPNSQTIVQGSTPSFTYSLTGFIDGDTSSTAGISGSASFNIDNYTGATGVYNVAYLKGLASSLGYLFVDNTASINELTVLDNTASIYELTVLAKPVNVNINLNFFNFFLSQIAFLQTSTSFTNWYNSIATNNSDYVDTYFGQYKGGAYSLNTVGSKWGSEHGKQKHGNKNKSLYATLLYILESNGIKLPAGLLANLKL